MAEKKSAKSRTNAEPRPPEGAPELIVVTQAAAGVRTTGAIASTTGADVAPLEKLLTLAGVELNLLFGDTEERLQAEVASVAPAAAAELPDLSTFYHVDGAEDRLEELAEQFLELDTVEAAYVKPAAELAVYDEDDDDDDEEINRMEPAPDDAPLATPNFTSRQIYLNAAPAGIDAKYAWTKAGGRGQGVRIIDLEWGWNFNQEDLLQNQGGVVAGTNSSNNNHGTAVLGEFSGDRNSIGVTGICSDAIASAVAFSMPTAKAVRTAANRLRAGDIMLLEIHRPGPNATGSGQFGFIAIEWWPDDFAAIRYAVNRGIIVVEAAGNGSQDFDAGIYNRPLTGFPASWRNPFNPSNPSSGAVVVGAGAPPPGTHGRNLYGPDRSRLGFSNYGRRVDCQGWGREVTSTGYGNLQGGPNRNRWYTDTFSGTSSASPIVVGALGCVQGILRKRGATLLNPTRARNLLRSTGSSQQDAPGRPRTQRIGNRPNLRQMIQALPTATRYSGVFRAGSGAYGLWVNASWSSFLQKWQQWSSQGLRLIDFDTTGSGSQQRYSGVFRRGSGGYGLWVNASWSSFLQKWQQWSSQGLRLIDFETSGTGSQQRYSGVFRQGSGGYGLWVNASWSSFVQKWQQWSSQGLRLIDLKITGSGSQARYSGVFRRGSGAYGLWVNASWSSFVQKWQQWSSQGLRLIDVEVMRSGNQTRYSGVFRRGSGSYGLWANTNWDSFVQKWQQWSSQGLRLIDMDVTKTGQSPSAPGATSSDEILDLEGGDDSGQGNFEEAVAAPDDDGVGEASFDSGSAEEAAAEDAEGVGHASFEYDADTETTAGFGEASFADDALEAEPDTPDGFGDVSFEGTMSKEYEPGSPDGFGDASFENAVPDEGEPENGEGFGDASFT